MILTDQELLDLNRVKKLTEELDSYVSYTVTEISKLVEPIIKRRINSNEELEELIKILPPGFHRTELRTLLNMRQYHWN